MSHIIKTELRTFTIAGHSITYPCFHLDEVSAFTSEDWLTALSTLNGLTSPGFVTMETTYPGYDSSLAPFEYTEGNMVLRQTIVEHPNYHGFATSCDILVNGKVITSGGGSGGYSVHHPRVEFTPKVVFLYNNKVVYFSSLTTFITLCFNNSEGDLTVVSNGFTYYWLIDTGLPCVGAFSILNLAQLNVDIDDISVPASLSPDPYAPGGHTTTGGGTGNFDGTSDPVDIPPLPTLSAVDTGLITIYAPTKTQVIQLANYLWTDPTFDLTNLRKLFANPMDCILGMSIVPVHVPTGTTQVLKVGNIATSVSLSVAASQYVEVDCGSLNVNEYWGAYLDYDPYTKAEIYLPYIGTQPLSVDDIMGKTVHVVYHIDILSGACCAYVKCGSSVLYSFIGQCTSSVPVSGNDWTSVVNGALSIAGQLGGLAAGAANPVSSLASMASTALTQMKPSIEKSGAMAGTGGLMGVQTPYIILTRPRQALPREQAHFTGYPAFITRTLSEVTGYTEVEEIHLEDIPATAPELTELENLLKGGVLL